MRNSSRIILNTLVQYLRTIINMVLSLYSTRLVLSILGVDDYGIYTVIAGVVSMLSFVTSSLVVTTQRFVSYYQGKEDKAVVNVFFDNCFYLHFIVALFLAISLYCITPWLIDLFLNIPNGREVVARNIYYIVILILYISVIAAPYRALLVSRENIIYISLIDVCDGVMKVVIAVLLPYVTYDKLEMYVFLLLVIQLFNFFAFFIYDILCYQGCRIPNVSNVKRNVLREIFSFAGWNVFNTASVVGRNQGVALVLNKFFSTAVNSAYGLSFQIYGCVGFISQSLKNAISPQTIQAYGNGNVDRMKKLMYAENKYAFMLLTSVSIPVIFEMPNLLSLWLNEVPKFSVLFSRMTIISAIVDIATTGYSTANLAIGKLRLFSIWVYGIKLLTPVFSCIFLMFWNDVISVFYCFIFFEFLSSFMKVYCISKLLIISCKETFVQLCKEIFLPVSLSTLGSYVIVSFFEFQYRFLLTIGIMTVLYLFISWNTIMDGNEKQFVLNFISKKLKRI